MAEATCTWCGDRFHGREDARFCSSRCRQASYRSQSKIKGEQSPAGFRVEHPERRYGNPQLEPCPELIKDDSGTVRMCGEIATWKLWEQQNHGSHIGPWTWIYLCNRHLKARSGSWDVTRISTGHTSVRWH